jgi:hypothetical protein
VETAYNPACAWTAPTKNSVILRDAATIRRGEREFLAPSRHRVLEVRVREPTEAPDA